MATLWGRSDFRCSNLPPLLFSRLLPKFGAGGKFDVSVNEYRPKINLRRSALLMVLAIGLMILAGWLLARENFYQMLGAVRTANPVFIVVAIAVYFFSVGIWAIRWQKALSFINCETSFSARYLILCATIFFNNITPGARVGGDPFGRVYMLHKLENTSYSSGMASSIGEHALTPLVIVSFLIAGLFLQFGKTSLRLGLVLILALIFAAFGIVFIPRVFFKRKIAVKRISKITNRVLGWFGKGGSVEEIMGGIEAFYTSSYSTIDKWRKIFWIGLFTLVIGALDVFRLYIIFLALGYYPKLSMLLVASALPTIVGLIPFLPGGLVIVEGSLISIFALFGVPLNLAIAATAIERGISFVLSTIVGAGVFSYLGVKMAAKPGVRS
ncbi:MAG: flippase-like domain-containing protein [Chloroflexi bacterium]|nr:flippase-like domain-containing protein [Chloroflexota bacterium]